MYTTTDTAAGGMSLLDFPAPAGRVISGAFNEALETNPVPLFMMSRELNAAKGIGPKLTKPDAEQQATMAGVKVTVPDDGLTQGALALLIERRRDQAARQLLFSRSEGAGAALGQFGASLAGTMLDPVNAAAGFIPVLGGTRYTELLAQAKGAGARAAFRGGIGAAEGVVGAAAVEGPTITLRRELQDDYGLYDSLANIAFGTLASSGLRMVGGAASDAWRATRRLRQAQAQGWADLGPELERAMAQDLEAGSARGPGIPEELRAQMEEMRRAAATPDGAAGARRQADFFADAQPIPHNPHEVAAAISSETHANALRGAVAQAVDGRNIDVDPIVRQDPVFGPQRMGQDAVRERAIAMQSNDNLVGADRQASLFADEALQEKPTKAAKPAKAEQPLYRGASKSGQTGQLIWATPDRTAAAEYANLHADGQVQEIPAGARKLAGPADVKRIAKKEGIDMSEQSAYSALAPETFKDAGKLLEAIEKAGYDGVKLPTGEDFAPSGKAIESVGLFSKKMQEGAQAQKRPASPELAEAEALLAETRQNAEQAAAAAGVQPTPTDQARIRGEDYEKAYRALGDCLPTEGR